MCARTFLLLATFTSNNVFNAQDKWKKKLSNFHSRGSVNPIFRVFGNENCYTHFSTNEVAHFFLEYRGIFTKKHTLESKTIEGESKNWFCFNIQRHLKTNLFISIFEGMDKILQKKKKMVLWVVKSLIFLKKYVSIYTKSTDGYFETFVV